jgi:hypothetical protein
MNADLCGISANTRHVHPYFDGAMTNQDKDENSQLLPKPPSTSSAVASMLGLGIDAMLQATLALPVGPLDVASKAVSAFQVAKSSFLQYKLYLFFREAESIDSYIREERAEWADRLNKKGLGRQIVLMLERADDERKAPLYAQLYCALIRRELTREQFGRLCACVDRAYFDDLKHLSEFQTPVLADESIKPIAESLQNASLLSIAGSDSGGFNGDDDSEGGIVYELNDRGRLFSEATNINEIDWIEIGRE